MPPDQVEAHLRLPRSLNVLNELLELEGRRALRAVPSAVGHAQKAERLFVGGLELMPGARGDMDQVEGPDLPDRRVHQDASPPSQDHDRVGVLVPVRVGVRVAVGGGVAVGVKVGDGVAVGVGDSIETDPEAVGVAVPVGPGVSLSVGVVVGVSSAAQPSSPLRTPSTSSSMLMWSSSF